jgi:ribosomal protein L11 methyltransferase
MTWSLSIEVAEAEAEEIATQLFAQGASGVEVRDGSVVAMPGVVPPGPGRTVLVAWFPSRAAAEEATRALPGGQVAEVADRDWGESWKEGLKPIRIGRVFVRPSWASAEVPAGCVEVVLDPGMAFGTGTHPTTALCLAALDEALAARPGCAVLDVGTGSGLLAIAAARLGAGRVVGTDNDPVALRVAAENAGRNGLSVRTSDGSPSGTVDLSLTGAGLTGLAGPFQVVVANILANTLEEMAPELVRLVAPGGALLISGILRHQEEGLLAAFGGRGLGPGEARRQQTQDDHWSLLLFGRDR